MIIDNIDHADMYFGIGERITTALRYLQQSDFFAMKPGRYNIEDNNIFALVQEYMTKKLGQAEWEAHREYIDIQFMAEGEEQIGYESKSGLPVKTQYDESEDCEYFETQGSFLHMKAGMFMILAPEDVHAPGVMTDEPKMVRKIVMKVKI